MSKWLEPESRKRRIVLGLFVYVVCLVVFALLAGDRLTQHTPYNHYALQADAWVHGRQDLLGGPPGYAGMNDFAKFENHWYISFPPFPAVLMVPLVWASGSAENFRDGQFIVWMAGIGPTVLFLVLEKLRRTKRSPRTERENLFLSLLFAFGTVYFFTAVQGTVWFAAHVIGGADRGKRARVSRRHEHRQERERHDGAGRREHEARDEDREDVRHHELVGPAMSFREPHEDGQIDAAERGCDERASARRTERDAA